MEGWLAQEHEKGTERLGNDWIHLVIHQLPEEKIWERKLGRNNNTKIDNLIFGVLQTFAP